MYFRSFPKSSGERFNALVARPFGGVADEVFADGAFPATASSYSLDAQPASYAFTSLQTGLTRALVFDAAAGAFALTGAAGTLGVGRAFDAQAGAFSFTGTDGTLSLGRSLDAQAGAAAVTGLPAVPALGRSLNASPGVLALTGLDAATGIALSVSADLGAVAATGFDAGLIAANEDTLAAEGAAFLLLGPDATMFADRSMAAMPASFAAAGVRALLALPAWIDPRLLRTEPDRAYDAATARSHESVEAVRGFDGVEPDRTYKVDK